MRKYFKTPDIDWYKQRLSKALLFIIFVFAILFTRLFYLQIIKGSEFTRLSESNCIRLQSISPSRGLIYDRNGVLLVDNRPSFNLSIVLKDAKPLSKTIENLSYFTGVAQETLKSKISAAKNEPSYKPVILMQDIDRDILARVEAHKNQLPGVSVDIQAMRNYISPKRAAHLIGYLSEIDSVELASGKYRGCKSGDYIGKFGVEKSFENYLRGEHGGRQVEVNAAGQVIRILQTVEAQPGFNIYLTIDQKLQDKTEELLNGRVGTAIAMDPKNGEILAMASSPSFDQNAFVNDLTHREWNALISNSDRPMENKAIQGEYPPASTYKIITAIAGLSEGIVNKDTFIFCSGGYFFGNRVFKDWKKEGHGSVNIIAALAQSCDVYFYQLGQKLGVDKLSWYAKACGLGELTGINLDHEKKGLIPSTFWKKERIGTSWQAGETLSVAIGQGYNLATPLQMLGCISAVASGKNVYRPLIIKKMESVEGEVVYQSKAEDIGALPIGRQELEIVREGLFKAVNDPRGTAYESKIKGILMAGKTGTAQVIGRAGDDAQSSRKLPRHFMPHAWFVAYAPFDNPKIAVSVLVEHGEHGSSAAAPIAGEMIKTYLESRTESRIQNPEFRSQNSE